MQRRDRSRERERDRRDSRDRRDDRDRCDDRDRRDARDRERRDDRRDSGGPRRPSGNLPPRAPSNPLIAEAFRLARERAKAQAAAGSDGEEEPVERPASRGWRAALEDDGELPEDGELPASPARGGTDVGRKRKHAPIVWSTPPKAAPAGLPQSGSSKGLEGLSAADRAMEELRAFQEQQAAADSGGESSGGGPVMKPSPSVSGGEEEEQQLEGQGAMEEQQAAGQRGSGSPAGDPHDEELVRPQKRLNRWTTEDVAAAEGAQQQPQQGSSPVGAAEPEADAEAQAASGGGSGEPSPARSDQRSPRFVKRAVSMLEECRSVECYEKLNRISEGTYGVVYRARDRETGEICALKKVKLEKERDGFPLTSIREINILLSLDHPHIVNVSEVVVGPSLDAVFMVMEYADHDLKAVMDERMTQPFSVAEVKTLMQQLLSGMAYLHDSWVLHRDLKTSNILYTNRGELKLCDFGLARQYGSPLAPYTHMVVTLWYRPPELLLGAEKYSTAVDVWSIGCIMAELLSKEALFPAKSEIELLTMILKTCGSPTEQTWPGLSQLKGAKKFNLGKYPAGNLRQRFPPAGLGFDGRPPLSEAGFDLLRRLLELCPEKRISCAEALRHPWFSEQPLPKDTALMPTFPATNDSVQARHAAQRRHVAAAAAGR